MFNVSLRKCQPTLQLQNKMTSSYALSRNYSDFCQECTPSDYALQYRYDSSKHNKLFQINIQNSRLKIQNWEPATVVKILLDELDTLIGDVIKMLQSCCETTNFQDTNTIQLNQSLSLRK